MPINNKLDFSGEFQKTTPLLIGLLLLLFLLFPQSGPAFSQSQETSSGGVALVELKPGASVVREIAGGEEQTFEISLNRHEYFQFALEKGDLNVSISLFGSGGRKIWEHTSHEYGTPEISTVTDSTGTFTVKLRSLEAPESRRQYVLKVGPLRNASERDFKDGAASSVFAEASQLCAEWTEASLRKAIEKYTEAWHTWRLAGNFRSAGRALAKAGEVYFTLGEYRQALERYERAALEGRRAGDKFGESDALSQVSRLYSLLGRNDKAQQHLTRELKYFHARGGTDQSATLKLALARTLSSLGEVYYSKGDLIRASNSFEQSLKLFSEIGDRNGEARSHLFLGYIALTIGEFDKAVAQFGEARTLYRFVNDKTGEALTIIAVGIHHSLKREEELALRMHREAMDTFRVIGDRQSEGITLNAIGQAYENLNEKQLALDNYKQALKLFLASGTVDFAAVAIYQIAGVYRSIGALKEALANYQECIGLSRAANKKRIEAYALNDVAAIYASQGKRSKARSQYQKILRFYIAIADRRGQAFALNNIGDYHLALGQSKTALSSYNLALPLSREAGERGIEISTLYNIARAERQAGAIDEAVSHIEQAIDIIESLRTNVASPDLRSSYFSGVRKYYDLYIDFLMQLDREHPGRGYGASALAVSERSRARSLLEILAEVRIDIRSGADPALIKREQELQRLLQAQARYQVENSSITQSESDPEADRGIDMLRAEYEELQGKVRNQSPHYTTLIQPKLLKLKDIQAELNDRNTLLLEYALGDEKSYLWAVTSDSMNSYELPGRIRLETAAQEVYSLLTARQPTNGKIDEGYQARVEAADREYYKKALALSQMLLGPVSSQLGSKRIIVVTEGALQYVPLEALPIPEVHSDYEGGADSANSQQQPLLISQHEIVGLPSISTLAAIRREEGPTAMSSKIVAILADPVFNYNDERVQANKELIASRQPEKPVTGLSNGEVETADKIITRSNTTRLTHTSEEADAIVAAAPRGTTIVAKGFDASREMAMSSEFAEYQIVHFATHGLIDTEHPQLSGIVLSLLSPTGETKNGVLQLHDIYNLKLSANLVILSACDTARGKDIQGEGLIGLTRGFMHGGAKSVVASLWKVDDRATSVLMGYFYHAMLQEGMPPAAALRFAKESMRRQTSWSAPYFWAGFGLQGEYREPIKVSHKSSIPAGVLVVASVLMLGLIARKIWHRIT